MHEAQAFSTEILAFAEQAKNPRNKLAIVLYALKCTI